MSTPGEHLKNVGDIAALGGAFGSLFAYLPEIAAGLAALWTLIRIIEWAVQKYNAWKSKQKTEE